MDDKDKVKLGCGIGSFLFLLPVRASLVNYALASVTGHGLAFGWAMFAALILGQFTAPLAMVCWCLRAVGVPVPFITMGMH